MRTAADPDAAVTNEHHHAVDDIGLIPHAAITPNEHGAALQALTGRLEPFKYFAFPPWTFSPSGASHLPLPVL